MFKTGLLLAAITALFLTVGYLTGGEAGMLIALGFALITNFASYWFSDRIVLRMYRAEPIDPAANPKLYSMIEDLARRAQVPMPKAYIMDNPQPNAFATGRNPQNGAVAVTTGLLNMLSEREIAAVIAHEIGHIKNRDTLTMTVTATLAGAIGMLANFAMFFGGGSRSDGRSHPVAGIAVALLAPLAAMLVQMAISRTREYRADAEGALIAGDADALANALRKISEGARRIVNPSAENNPATAHLFIMNPLAGRGVDNLFSTHPSTENRIAALERLSAGLPGRPVTEAEPDQRTITKRGSFDF